MNMLDFTGNSHGVILGGVFHQDSRKFNLLTIYMATILFLVDSCVQRKPFQCSKGIIISQGRYN